MNKVNAHPSETKTFEMALNREIQRKTWCIPVIHFIRAKLNVVYL